MIRILPWFAAALAACAPAPQESAMRGSSHDPGITSESASRAGFDASGGAMDMTERVAGKPQQAALGPVPEPVSAAENPVPALPADSSREAQGRRTLSTAFVRVGPDGVLTVTLRNGSVLVLRNLVMRRKDYCGVQMLPGRAGAKYCGGYSEIATARPGGPPAPAEPDLAVPNPVEEN